MQEVKALKHLLPTPPKKSVSASLFGSFIPPLFLLLNSRRRQSHFGLDCDMQLTQQTNFPPKRHPEETGILHAAAAPRVSQEHTICVLHIATNKFQQNSATHENKKNTERGTSPTSNLTGEKIHRSLFSGQPGPLRDRADPPNLITEMPI